MDRIVITDLYDGEIPIHNAFNEVYELQHKLDSDITQNTYLGENRNSCRFCGKVYPNAKFTKDAHVIPQSIGNRYLLSNFECDACNELFGKYENSFTNYLSHLRPFNNIVNKNRKNKGVKHTETKTGLQIQSVESGIELYVRNSDTQIVSVNYEKKEVTIEITRPKYIPFHIYKTILKIALCAIHESEVNLIKEAFNILQSDNFNNTLSEAGYFRIYDTIVHGNMFWPKPFGLLYRKKVEAKEKLNPSKVFSLFFANHVFQICLPLYVEDQNLTGKKFEVLRSPIPITQSLVETFGKPSRTVLDLSSSIAVADSKETITLTFEDYELPRAILEHLNRTKESSTPQKP